MQNRMHVVETTRGGGGHAEDESRRGKMLDEHRRTEEGSLDSPLTAREDQQLSVPRAESHSTLLANCWGSIFNPQGRDQKFACAAAAGPIATLNRGEERVSGVAAGAKMRSARQPRRTRKKGRDGCSMSRRTDGPAEDRSQREQGGHSTKQDTNNEKRVSRLRQCGRTSVRAPRRPQPGSSAHACGPLSNVTARIPD